MYTVAIKSGTGGHHDYDGYKLVLAKVESTIIPQIGSKLMIGDSENRYHKPYLVQEVEHFVDIKTKDEEENVWTTVYVIPA